jgi:hypothetical protein
MQYTRVGSSGLKVSRIALGCMSFGAPSQDAPWTLNEAAAGSIFEQAIELGTTFWYAANVYAQGTSEEIVGTGAEEIRAPGGDRACDQGLLPDQEPRSWWCRSLQKGDPRANRCLSQASRY